MAEFGPPRGEAEIRQVEALTRSAYGHADWTEPGWWSSLGSHLVRVLRDAGEPVASLALVPMGQWFRGHSVPMTGISSVAVRPDRWRTGCATRLMRATLEELGRAGVALSSLNPASLHLYRSFGYESAGTRHLARVPARAIGVRSNELAVRRIRAADHPAVERLHSDFARRFAGHLDRHAYIWSRVRAAWTPGAEGYLVHDGDAIEGYVYYSPATKPRGRYDLYGSDLAFITPRAGRRLLAFLGDHAGTGEDVWWPAHPTHPALALLPEQTYTLEPRGEWMLRVVDVPSALAARGYPDGIDAELHLAVSDDNLPANNASWVLRVAKGRGEMARGGTGSLSLDVRALAALFSGYRTPAQLQLSTNLVGTERDLELATTLFAGPAPWMPDGF